MRAYALLMRFGEGDAVDVAKQLRSIQARGLRDSPWVKRAILLREAAFNPYVVLTLTPNT